MNRRFKIFISIVLILISCGCGNESAQFAVIGDFGEDGKALQDVAQLVNSWKPDFIITVGDNNYPNGTADTMDANIGKYFSNYIYPYKGTYTSTAQKNRFFPTLGNHDWRTQGAIPYLDYFTLPGNERYYEFKRGPVHFFALDSDPNEPDGVIHDSPQALWLKNKLALSTSPFKVVYMHHPPYTSGITHGPSVSLRWPFKQWGADVVISGHEHLYERLLVDGLPFIVNGLGGRNSIYGFGTPVESSVVRYNETFGALYGEATAKKLQMSFFDTEGTLIDHVEIASD